MPSLDHLGSDLGRIPPGMIPAVEPEVSSEHSQVCPPSPPKERNDYNLPLMNSFVMVCLMVMAIKKNVKKKR